MKKTLRILQLYPKDMNIYGDWGNTIVLKQRAIWHGYEIELLEYNQGDEFPGDIDIIVGGGGQDTGQMKIKDDLPKITNQLKKLADSGTPMLVICGLYQLFGHFFTTYTGDTIQGVGILDMETHGKSERLIGNVVSKSNEFGDIVGYENHSGQTFLKGETKPLGTIEKGVGNNQEDSSEGARIHNVLGSYLHGSLLPKNPQIADWLIETAATKKYGEFTPHVIDDRFSDEARVRASARPR